MDYHSFIALIRLIGEKEKNLTLKQLTYDSAFLERHNFSSKSYIRDYVDALVEDGFLFLKPYKILKNMQEDTEYKVILSQKAKDHLDCWNSDCRDYFFQSIMSDKKCPFGSFTGMNKFVSNNVYHKIERLLKKTEQMGLQENGKITTAGKYFYMNQKNLLYSILGDDYAFDSNYRD